MSRGDKVNALSASVAALAMGVVGICNAATLAECPQTVPVTQAAQSAPEGWVPMPYSGPQRLVRVGFKLRSDPGELRADEERGKPGKRMLAWNVDGMKGLEQVCVYAGTLARLSRPVEGVVTRCEVRESRLPGGALQVTAQCR